MKSLYNPEVLKEITDRIENLAPASPQNWGKMNVSQMMEHCSRALDFSTGKVNPPRLFIGYILGPLFKPMFYNDKPWARNTQTAPDYIVKDQPDFEAAKKRMLELMKEFSEGGEAKATRHPSPFFGKLTPEQHGLGQYKHIDHHLQQFGV
jgi:hypothetical protein